MSQKVLSTPALVTIIEQDNMQNFVIDYTKSVQCIIKDFFTLLCPLA